MKTIAMPSRCCRLAMQLEDLRLDGDVERGGRLVGDQQVGIVGERHGDHHALALAAGQFVRIGLHAPLGIRDADERQQLDGARPRRRARRGRWWCMIGSMSWLPIV